MNEANPQPSYLPNRQVYCLHNLAKSVNIPGKKTDIHHLHWSQSLARYLHNSRKSQRYTYIGSAGHLVLPSLVTEFNKVCTTQFKENPVVHLPR